VKPGRENRTRAHPTRRRRRWLARLIPVLLGVALIAVLLPTRTPLAKSIVLPRLERMLGVEIEAGGLYVTAGLRVVITDATVRAPAVDGVAGEVASLRRLEAELDWGRLLSGNAAEATRGLVVSGPVIRLSQDIDSGVLNAATIRPDIMPGGSGAPSLPLVVIEDGRVELGEHEGGSFTLLHEVPFEGELTPGARTGAGVDVFVLRPQRSAALEGLGGDFGETPELRGRIDGDGASVLISGVGVERWPASRVPTRVRPAYESLGIRGRIEPRRVRVGRDGTVELDVEFQRVALDLPFTAVRPGEDPSVEADEKPLRMTGVTGGMTVGTSGLGATIDGFVDEVPYGVAFDYWGLRGDAPFLARLRAGPVAVERGTNIFRFTPEVVVEKLDLFIEPVATVTSTVWLRRGTTPRGDRRVRTADLALPDQLAQPAGPADSRILIAGEIALADGAASYRNFPYPFEEIAGRFLFDQERLVIDNITARSDAGATLTVDGEVTPLSDAAAVELRIDVRGVPIDERLFASIGPERRELLEAIFSTREQAELYDRGLLRPPRAPPTGGDADAAPEFAVGGTVDVAVDLRRLYGTESVWPQRLEIALRDARLLSEQFPVPLLGDDVRLTIEDNIAVIDQAAFTTLAGGSVSLSATADVSKDDDRDPPTVRVVASDVPVHAPLIAALPDTGPIGGTANLADLLDRLGLSGPLSCIADVEPDPVNGVDWNVVVNVQGLEARPRAAATFEPADAHAVRLRGVVGTVRTRRDRVEIELSGEAVAARTEAPIDEPGPAPAEVAVAVAIELPDPAAASDSERPGPGVDGRIDVRGFDATLRIEPLLSLFAPDVAGIVRGLRADHDPAGRVDFVTRLELDPNEAAAGPDVTIDVERIETLALDLLGGRFDLSDVAGGAALTTSGGPAVSFERVEADVRFDGAPAGRATLTGVLTLGEPEPWPLIGVPDFPLLGVDLVGGTFESILTRRVAVERLGSYVVDLYEDRRPTGLYDLDLALALRAAEPTDIPRDEPDAAPDAAPRAAPQAAPVDDGSGPAPITFDVSGELRPRTLAIATSGGRLAVDEMDGAVRFSPRGGTFDALAGRGRGWGFESTGDWRVADRGAFRVSANVAATVDPADAGIPADLLDALPDAAAETLEGLGLDATGGLELRDGRLIVERPAAEVDGDEDGPGIETLARGDVLFKGGTFDVGLPVTRADGAARFEAWTLGGPGDADRGWSINLTADRLFLAGIEMSNARARVLAGRTPGAVLLPNVSADVYGGRLASAMRVDPEPADPPTDPTGRAGRAGRAFSVETRLADVRLAPLLEALSVGLRPEPEALARLVAAANERRRDVGVEAPDDSRGVLDADLTFSGTTADREALRGRGSLRTSGGPVLALPVLTPLIEFSNLQLPVGERLDLAEASFFVDGDRVTFESLGVLSNSIEIVGFGSMHWPTAEVDLRFRSEALRRVPVLSDIIEAVRDELITTRVTGELGNPEVSADTLTATRRVLRSLVGLSETPEAARLRRFEERARAERDRAVGVIRRNPGVSDG